MNTQTRTRIEMGQLALSLVLEDFRRRVERGEMTETVVADIVSDALGRFPPEFEADLRSYMATATNQAA